MRPFILTSAVATTLLIGQASVRSSGSQSSLAQPTSFPLVDVQELVLDNGFKVLVVEGSQVPRVAASLWYRLGSLQERIGEHGSTHFLEHVVHQGTTTVGTKNFEAEKSLLRQIYETEQKLLATRNRERNRLRQRDVFFGDLDWPTTPEIEQLRRRLYELEDEDAQYREFWAEYNWYRRYGAVSSHTDPVPATTGHEQLEIDIDMPRENIELLFRLEADRMANAVLRGWEAQRFTVLEQILGGRQRAADPRGRFYEVINGVTGVVHPMFRRSGGHLRDFAFYNRASMLRMYDDYFVPNATRPSSWWGTLRGVRSSFSPSNISAGSRGERSHPPGWISRRKWFLGAPSGSTGRSRWIRGSWFATASLVWVIPIDRSSTRSRRCSDAC